MSNKDEKNTAASAPSQAAQKKAGGWSTKRIIFCAAGILAYALIGWLLTCPPVLHEAASAVGASDHAAMICLGSMIFSIVWWIGGVTADWVTALTMVTSWVLFGIVSIPKAFAPFAEGTIWLVVGGFAIAAAVTKTGLLRRIAFNMMKLFPATFEGQTLALMAAGTICSPLIPSSTAKGVLGGSIALASSEAMKLPENSKERAGMFLASWYGFGLAAPAFMSASAIGYIVKGFLPEDVQARITWGSWFVAMIPWLIIFFVLMYFGNLLLYRPKEKLTMSKEYIDGELAKMGKMGSQEKLTAAVLCGCLILWILEKTVGINATVTALIGALVCFITGILSPKDIAQKVPWGLLIFVSSVLSLGNRFNDMGLGAYINSFFAPIFGGMNNIVLLLTVMCVMIYVARFFIAAQPVVVSMFLGIMMPLVEPLGVDVFIIAMVMYTAVNNFWVTFQNPVYAASYGAMNGTIQQKHCMNAATLYAVVTLLACIASLPYWKLLGYIS